MRTARPTRCIICELAGLPCQAVHRGLYCVEHLALLPQVYRERLEAVRRCWRARSLGRSLPAGGLPPPSPWETAAHRWLFPEAQAGVPSHPYTRWYVAACAATAWILCRLWEGVFPVFVEPNHVTAGTCPCPLCALARQVAVKAVERQG